MLRVQSSSETMSRRQFCTLQSIFTRSTESLTDDTKHISSMYIEVIGHEHHQVEATNLIHRPTSKCNKSGVNG
jgi:hypothetical protein